MTTVAYQDGVLASDSLTTSGDTKTGEVRKVYKLRDGRLYGFCGTVENGVVLQEAMAAGADLKKPPKLSDLSAIIIDMDGVIYKYEGRIFRKLRNKYFAIGSGMDFALAILWDGGDAVRAVKAAIHFDKNSGGRVQTVKI